MELRRRAFGMAVGILVGLLCFLSTHLSIWLGMGEMGETVSLLGLVMPGYSVTFVGALVGLFYGLVYGFFGGALVAWLYNKFCKVLYKS